MLEQTSPLRLYAAGLRVSELISLTVKDIDTASGHLSEAARLYIMGK